MRALDASATVFLGIRMKRSTPGAENETGQLLLYWDAVHADTIAGKGCGPNNSSPGPEDRRIRMSYQAPPGTMAATVPISQDVGTCAASSGPWETASPSQLTPWQRLYRCARIEVPLELP